MIKVLVVALSLCTCSLVQSAIPADYQAIVVKSKFSFSERTFDLTPAVERARAENKNIFIYLGATDCPPCREYEIFLQRNGTNLKPSFEQLVVVDIQTWLRGPEIHFLIDEKKLSLAAFRELVGDGNTRLIYPSFWILSPQLKQIRQLPTGNKEFLDLQRHKEMLK
jgi:thiol-disulfide isomerase/thioredoxin